MGYKGVGMDCPTQLSSLKLTSLDKSDLSIWQVGTFSKSFGFFIMHVFIVYYCHVLLSNVSHKARYSVEAFDGIFS